MTKRTVFIWYECPIVLCFGLANDKLNIKRSQVTVNPGNTAIAQICMSLYITPLALQFWIPKQRRQQLSWNKLSNKLCNYWWVVKNTHALGMFSLIKNTLLDVWVICNTVQDEVFIFYCCTNSCNHQHTRHRIQQEGFTKKVLTLNLRVLLAFECWLEIIARFPMSEFHQGYT